ncbi:MAG: metallophosphoesterase [Nitrososphaerales archaeon]
MIAQARTQRVSTIKVMDGLDLVSPYPAAFLEKSRALVIADTHLGIEVGLASRGVAVPDSVFRSTLDSVLIPAREMQCKWVYILGDLKHAHRRLKESEWWAVRRFVNEIRAIGAEPILVMGNHDRHVTPILRALKVSYHRQYATVDDFVLTHGHRRVKLGEKSLVRAIIIGHEHPAVSIRNEFGRRGERFKAFLFVKSWRKNPSILVLPSVNPLAFGTNVGELSTTKGFLSPWLKQIENFKEIQPYALEVGELLLRFPSISALKR